MFSLGFLLPLDLDTTFIKFTHGYSPILTSLSLSVVMLFWNKEKFVMEVLAANLIAQDIYHQELLAELQLDLVILLKPVLDHLKAVPLKLSNLLQ